MSAWYYQTTPTERRSPSVDRCGERGEFHTFCYVGPIFAETLAVRAGERFVRDGFHFTDVVACEQSAGCVRRKKFPFVSETSAA
jgi:diphthamide synthase (EF-2-diphthine--ammonia ligase)